MPSSLDVVSNPIINGLVIFCAVLDIIVDLVGIVRLAWPVPGAHMNSDGQTVGEELLRGLDVNILGYSSRSGVEVGMVGSELSSVCCGLYGSEPRNDLVIKLTYRPSCERFHESFYNSNEVEQSQPCCS